MQLLNLPSSGRVAGEHGGRFGKKEAVCQRKAKHPNRHFWKDVRVYDVVLYLYGASLIAQLVKNPPAMQETSVQLLGQEDPLEKGSATHSSVLRLPLWLNWIKNPPALWETWV